VHNLRDRWTPREFDERAAARGVVLAVGFHVIYELARAFVRHNPRSVADVKASCSFLADIERVEYLPAVGALIEAELTEAALGVPLVTVLSPLNHVSVRLELRRLALGYAEQAVRFISRRSRRRMPTTGRSRPRTCVGSKSAEEKRASSFVAGWIPSTHSRAWRGSTVSRHENAISFVWCSGRPTSRR
jgi:hypothetical protein